MNYKCVNEILLVKSQRNYQRVLVFIGLAFIAVSTTADAGPGECDKKMIDTVLAAATKKAPSVLLDCDLSLNKQSVVTKQLIFKGTAATGVTFDCNGATLRNSSGPENMTRILVASSYEKTKGGDYKWQPPENIVIRNCRIEGSVRVQGMAVNGEDKSLTDSSRRAGHTRRVQDNAPRNIVFDNDDLIGQGQIPLYFSPGVHRSRVLNSRISGTSNSVAIYFDAESANNILKGNAINTETQSSSKLKSTALSLLHTLSNQVGVSGGSLPQPYRELIALDGSANNKIINNRFNRLDHGGIFLYRNCGEGGNIRHQTSQGNEIINNIFYYDKFDARTPAIWLASRNGNRPYCGLDKGYPLGSSSSDLDYASENFIAQNQFFKFEPNKIIRDNAGNNYLESNTKIDVPINRKAGCYLKQGHSSRLLTDSGKLSVITGKMRTSCVELTCADGELTRHAVACRQ